MIPDYISIIGIPKIIGEVTAIGKWNGTNSAGILDPYTDIQEASEKIPCDELPEYLLVNNKTRRYLYKLDCNRIPYIESEFYIFGYDIPKGCCESVNSIMKNIIIKSILRISNELPDDIVLLVSNKNSIVIIHV